MKLAKIPQPDRRTLRRKGVFKMYTPFTPDEIELIDSWGFAQHIRARADVVRALVMKALEAAGPIDLTGKPWRER
jgi:hypothetical protein